MWLCPSAQWVWRFCVGMARRKTAVLPACLCYSASRPQLQQSLRGGGDESKYSEGRVASSSTPLEFSSRQNQSSFLTFLYTYKFYGAIYGHLLKIVVDNTFNFMTNLQCSSTKSSMSQNRVDLLLHILQMLCLLFFIIHYTRSLFTADTNLSTHA
jgi:hypothetical protein